jgi:drug/metabolite transporter (DMT)-like permease
MKRELPLSVVYLCVVLAMFFWGSAFVWVTQVLGMGFAPFTINFYRLLIASCLLFMISRLLRHDEVIKKSDYKLFFFLAFSEPFCYFLGETFGMLYVTPTLASIMISTIPLVTPFFAYMFLQERVAVYEVVGLIVSFSGVMLLVVENLQLGGNPIGIILMFVAVFSGTAYGILLKKLTCSYSPLTITKYQSFIGMLLFMPLFCIFDIRGILSDGIALEGFKYILLLGALPSTVSFTFLAIGVHRLGIIKTNIFSNLIPVFTAGLAYIVLRETFSHTKVLAMMIVLVGLVVSQLGRIKLRKSIET